MTRTPRSVRARRPLASARAGRRIAVLVGGAALTLAAAVALAGCSPTISVDQPPDANNPKCAEIMVRLPNELSDQSRVWTDAQSTAAWGTPTRIIMACGVTPPGPTTLKCVSLGGVDWIVDESAQPNFRITSYGRTPAVQVYLDGGDKSVDPNTVLTQLGRLVAPETTQTAECTNPDTISK